MKTNPRRKVAGHGFDRVGRIIDGLVDNGRLILMIVLCLSVGAMVRGLSELADPAVQPVAEQQAPIVDVQPDALTNTSTRAEVERRSDYRVKKHLQCADDAYRAEYEESCTRLDEGVEDAIENFAESELRKRQWPRDSGTRSDPDHTHSRYAVRRI